MFRLGNLSSLLLYTTIATCVVAFTPQLLIFPDITPSTNLTWTPCFDSFNCSRLDVPLDYLKPNGSRSSIPLVKLPAASTPYKGLLLMNPGGPGEAGIEFLRNIVNAIQVDPGLSILQALNQNYDLVSWDPRGIGLALPSASCNISGKSINSVKKRSLDKIYGPEGLDFQFTAKLNRTFDLSAQCQAQINGDYGIGSHMGTASVARDMISILDAFARSEDGTKVEDATLLNYWGISYGTFLGATFASMFPDRVGRMALDGVVEPDGWVGGKSSITATDTDDTFATFFIYCHLAGPSQCPFYTGSTAHDIYLRFETMISKLNSTYAMEQGWQNASDIDNALEQFRNPYIMMSLYQPITYFKYLAQGFAVVEAALMNPSNTTLETIQDELIHQMPDAINDTASTEPFVVLNDDEFAPIKTWHSGVVCLDNGGMWSKMSRTEILSRFKAFGKGSYLGGLGPEQNAAECIPWQISTDDRYAGPFGGPTKNPLLYVSNVLDPVTALANGQDGAARFDGAELLTIEAIGHSSFAARNRCAFSKIVTYFVNGTLPGKDNYCGPDAGPWNITIPGTLRGYSELSRIKRRLSALKEK